MPKLGPPPKPVAGVPVLLDVRQAAAALGLCRQSVYRAIARGEIRTVRIGGAMRIPAAQPCFGVNDPGANDATR